MPDLINQYWTKSPQSTESSPIVTSEMNWENEYAKQRKDRMQDAIDDYLNDDKVSSRQTYEEMLSCVDDVRQYHKQNYDKANELYQLMLGYRDPVTLG